ncbi:MAG: beta-L-arabinofuranosidase domain-containing protein [Myxococcales bacterium]
MTLASKNRSRVVRVVCVGLAALAALQPSLAQAADPVEKLQDFPLDQVQITDDYQKSLFSKDVTYLITTLNSDRLLAGFKAVSTGGTATNMYGGWESQNIRGHSMGHWLSAVAHAYQQAKGSDPALASQIKLKLDDVVSKLKTYQSSSGFLFATPISQFDDMDSGGSNNWVPYYTMHKILAGLIDVYEFEQNPDALTVASKMGDWLYNRANGWNASAKSRVLSSEYGGMNDALYQLYKYTKNANHLAVAHIFDDTSLFTSTAGGNDTLSGRHANMTIPKFIGALNRYRTLGTAEASYLTAADQFLALVLKNHTYVTGGNSEDEHFHEPGKLDARRDNLNNETCNAYNMSKLTRDLFKVTGDVKYADYYERVHINEILSSMNPTTGMTTYFKAMGTGYFKAFGTPESSFWCCTGTGMENFTKLGDSVYFHDATDLYVVSYVSSTVNWADRGLSVSQTTDLPMTNKVTVTINQAPLQAVTLKFRKPYWLASCASATVAVNSQSVNAVDSNGFLSVSQVWKAGDKVELTLPMEVQVSRLTDNQNAVAFTYGPIVLSAGLGTASMTTTGHAWTIMATKPTGLQETIAINSGSTINGWLGSIKSNLVQTPGKLEFNLKNTDSDGKLVFIPHYSRYQDRYGIYFKLSGTAGATVTPPACPPPTTGGAGGAGGSSGASASGGAGGDNPGSGGAELGGTPGLGGAGGAGSAIGGASTAGTATGGGAVGTGGSPIGGVAGSPASGGTSESDNGGCACGINKAPGRYQWSLAALMALAFAARRRRAGSASRATS